MLVYELPYPPSINRYWRSVAGRMIISSKGRTYRKAVVRRLAAEGARELGGRLAVKVEVYPPDRRRRDLDNVLKCLLDGLAHGGAYRDDSQIDRLVVDRCRATDGGRIIVKIAERSQP